MFKRGQMKTLFTLLFAGLLFASCGDDGGCQTCVQTHTSALGDPKFPKTVELTECDEDVIESLENNVESDILVNGDTIFISTVCN